jgi:hypothetical protein
MNPIPISRLMMAAVFFIMIVPATVWAGPPFLTDDPEPVEYKHGELYISSIYTDTKDGKTGTLPHVEFNYGVIPDMQLHLLIPLAFSHPNGGPTSYGIGDTELGVKYRFIHETDNIPQVGIFPLLHIPTGTATEALAAVMFRNSCRYGCRRAGARGLPADSDASRPLIPIEVGHPFRFKSAIYSD